VENPSCIETSHGRRRDDREDPVVPCAIQRDRIARLMRLSGLYGVSRRKGCKTTIRREEAGPAPDLVDRNFTATSPDQLWVADITYIPTWSGFLYLAVVLDAFSRRIVGWAMETRLKNRTRFGCPEHGAVEATSFFGDPPLRSQLPIHIHCLRETLQGIRCPSFDGNGG
jgi:transposase InsO family protein